MKSPNNLKETAIELIKTLSNDKSFFASKRVERMLLMGSVYIIALGTFFYEIYNGTLTATEACILIVPLLGAAGYNSFRTYVDKKLETNTDNGNSTNGAS